MWGTAEGGSSTHSRFRIRFGEFVKRNYRYSFKY